MKNAMTRLPSLYISHGSPMTALLPGLTGERLAELASTLPRPQAIVIASAHWLSRRPQVGGATVPETIHDFGGFPAALYQLRYPAPGAPALAGRVLQRCQMTEGARQRRLGHYLRLFDRDGFHGAAPDPI